MLRAAQASELACKNQLARSAGLSGHHLVTPACPSAHFPTALLPVSRGACAGLLSLAPAEGSMALIFRVLADPRAVIACDPNLDPIVAAGGPPRQPLIIRSAGAGYFLVSLHTLTPNLASQRQLSPHS